MFIPSIRKPTGVIRRRITSSCCYCCFDCVWILIRMRMAYKTHFHIHYINTKMIVMHWAKHWCKSWLRENAIVHSNHPPTQQCSVHAFLLGIRRRFWNLVAFCRMFKHWLITPAFYEANTWLVQTSKCDILSSNCSLVYSAQGNVARRSHGCVSFMHSIGFDVSHAHSFYLCASSWIITLDFATELCTCMCIVLFMHATKWTRDETEK